MGLIKHTSINTSYAFFIIDTQQIARIVWYPDKDQFKYDGRMYSREEFTKYLEEHEDEFTDEIFYDRGE